MDSALIVAVATMISVVVVVCATTKKWLDQYKIDQIRQSIEHIDNINRIHRVGKNLSPWLSREALHLLADMVDLQAQDINFRYTNLPFNAAKVLEYTSELRTVRPSNPTTPLPTQPKQATAIRDDLMYFLQLIKDGHREHLISTTAAHDRIQEATLLNARVCSNTYKARARHSLVQNTPNQALHFLKCAEKTIRGVKDLPPDLIAELNSLATDIRDLEEQRASSGASRLADEAEKLVDEEDFWRKKPFG